MRRASLVVRVALLVVSCAVHYASAAEVSVAEEAVGVVWPTVASHAARIEGDQVTWQTSYVRNTSSAQNARRERLDLERPVPGTLDQERSAGVEPILNHEGEIVAFAIDPQRAPSWQEAITVTIQAPLVRDGAAIVLSPPLAHGGMVQRVDITGDGDLRFEPAASDGIVRHVGAWSAPGITETARRDANDDLGAGSPVSSGRSLALDDSPVYLVASSPALEHGLRGRAQTATERARPGLFLAAVLFIALALGCAEAYRRLGQDAQIEQAEAALREEFGTSGGPAEKKRV